MQAASRTNKSVFTAVRKKDSPSSNASGKLYYRSRLVAWLGVWRRAIDYFFLTEAALQGEGEEAAAILHSQYAYCICMGLWASCGPLACPPYT